MVCIAKVPAGLLFLRSPNSDVDEDCSFAGDNDTKRNVNFFHQFLTHTCHNAQWPKIPKAACEIMDFL